MSDKHKIPEGFEKGLKGKGKLSPYLKDRIEKIKKIKKKSKKSSLSDSIKEWMSTKDE